MWKVETLAFFIIYLFATGRVGGGTLACFIKFPRRYRLVGLILIRLLESVFKSVGDGVGWGTGPITTTAAEHVISIRGSSRSVRSVIFHRNYNAYG